MTSQETCPECGAGVGEPHKISCFIGALLMLRAEATNLRLPRSRSSKSAGTGEWPNGRKRVVIEETGTSRYSRRFVLEAPVDFDMSELWMQEITDMADGAGVPWVIEDVRTDGTDELNEQPLPDDPIIHIESNPWGKVWEDSD